MERILFFILRMCFFFSLLACNGEFKKSGDKSIELTIENLELDTCRLRVYHMITGELRFDTIVGKTNQHFMISSFPEEDDVYLFVLSWPKIFLSHRSLKDRQFNNDVTENYELTKPLYISPTQTKNYKLSTLQRMTAEEVEKTNSRRLKLDVENCSDCLLAEQFWELYSGYFQQKNVVLDSLKSNMYNYVDKGDYAAVKKIYDNINTSKQLAKDGQLDEEIMRLSEENSNSPVSTFFIFYQLYHYREFLQYKPTFYSLKEDAVNNKYYKMMEKQYENLNIVK